MFAQTSFESDKTRKTDRIIWVSPASEQGAKSAASGTFDQRILTGGNRLHGVKDLSSGLWYFKWDKGGLTEPMKQKFTSFPKLLEFARAYFEKRNIKIDRIED